MRQLANVPQKLPIPLPTTTLPPGVQMCKRFDGCSIQAAVSRPMATAMAREIDRPARVPLRRPALERAAGGGSDASEVGRPVADELKAVDHDVKSSDASQAAPANA
jgi:hypothetical protein